MIENSGNSVIFYAHYTTDGVLTASLTVTIDIYEVIRDGTATLVVDDGACTEVGAGIYRYLLASGTVDAAAEYIGVFHTATDTVDAQDIPAMWVIDRAGTEKLDTGVTLADDAITAAKFDESTAYPLKSADTGATQVARVGADSDTLETLSDEIAAVKAETALIVADTGTDGVKIASAQTVATVTNLTNLPTMPTDWVTAAGLKADAVTEIQSGLATAAALAAIQADLDNPDQYKADVSGIPAAVWGYATRTLSSFGSLIADIWSHVTRTLSSFGFTVATNSDANVTAIKAKTDNLPANTTTTLAAIQSDLDNPAQYKADVSGLATTAHVQEVEDKIDVIDNVADAIKVKTDQLTFTVAGSVDATATADISGIAGDVWSHANRTLTNQGTSVTSPAEGDPLEIYRDTTVYITLTGIGATTGYTKIWFTVKEDLEDADTDAILQIDTTDKLKYIDGEAGTSTDGLLVIDSEEETADITLLQASARLLPVYTAYPAFWDLKMLNDGVVSLLSTGEIYIYSTPTRSIS